MLPASEWQRATAKHSETALMGSGANTNQNADAHSVSAALKQKILSGEFQYDERLPAERSIAEQFGCSRGTVRVAMERLEDLNLIERRIGSGTFVRHKAMASESEIANITSPLELIEVRKGLEVQAARLAVLNASARNLEALEKTVIELEALTNRCEPEEFSRADQAFHLTLAECTGNSLMLWMCSHINDVRCHPQWSVVKDKILTSAQIALYNQQHRTIFEAVAIRDIKAAEKVTIEHLDLARNDLLGAT